MPKPLFPVDFARDNLRRDWKFTPTKQAHGTLNAALRAMGGPALLRLYEKTKADVEAQAASPVRANWVYEVDRWWAFEGKTMKAKRAKHAIERAQALSSTGRRFSEIEKRISALEANVARDLRTLARAIDQLKGGNQ